MELKQMSSEIVTWTEVRPPTEPPRCPKYVGFEVNMTENI